MACLESNIKTNFLTWNKVSGSLTLSELQSSGLPSLCNTLSPDAPLSPAPQNLVATAISSSTISLFWDNVAGADSYKVYRSLTLGGTYTVIEPLDLDKDYDDTTCDPDTEYFYKVSAVIGGVESALTDAVSATTLSISLEKDSVNDYMTNTGDSLDLGTDTFSVIQVSRTDSMSSYLANLRYGAILSSNNDKFVVWELSSSFTNSGFRAVISESGGASRTINAQENTNLNTNNGVRKIFGFHKLSHDATLCKFSKGSVLYSPSTVTTNTLQATDNITLQNPVFGKRGASNQFYFGGLLDKIAVFQPALTQTQLNWFVINSYSVNDPTSAEAKTQGIGVDGVDIIGVDGITTLLKRYWKFDLVTLDTSKYYIREEVTDDNIYAEMKNFVDPSGSLTDFVDV